MTKKLEDSPLYLAVMPAYENPKKGLPILAKATSQAQHEGRLEEARVLAGNLITAAGRANRYLGTAERWARLLAKRYPY